MKGLAFVLAFVARSARVFGLWDRRRFGSRDHLADDPVSEAHRSSRQQASDQSE